MQNEVPYPKFRHFVMFAVAFTWFTFGVVTVIFAPLLPDIGEEFNREVGSLMIVFMSLNSVGIGLGTVVSGSLVDKIGPRKVLLGSSILVTVYLLSVPHFSQSVTQLVILRFCEGFVYGPVMSTLAKISQRWFPYKEQGRFNGIAVASIAVGFAATYLVFAPWLTYFDGNWRKMIQSISVLTIASVVLVAISLLGKEPPLHAWAVPAGSNPDKDFATALKLPVFWVGAIVLTLAMSFMQVVNGLTPAYVFSAKPLGLAMKPWIAGPCLAFIQVGMVLQGLLMGFILNKIFKGKPKYVCMMGFLASGVFSYCITLPFGHSSLQVLCVFLFLMGFFMNCNWPAISVFIATNYPPHILGRAFAVCSSCATFGAAALSALAGWMLDKTHTFTSVYLSCLIMAVVAALLASMMNPVTAFKKAPMPVANMEATPAD